MITFFAGQLQVVHCVFDLVVVRFAAASLRRWHYYLLVREQQSAAGSLLRRG